MAVSMLSTSMTGSASERIMASSTRNTAPIAMRLTFCMSLVTVSIRS